MAENDEMIEETEEFDPISEIQKLKENSVSKDEYAKLKKENARLMKTLVEGGQISDPTPKKSIPDMRKELFENEHLTNLEYCKRALELREAVMAEGGNDPFLPYGEKISPTQEDIDAAERVATVMKNAIEYANGDSQLFTNELLRNTKDVRR